jgi:hypothetical protein
VLNRPAAAAANIGACFCLKRCRYGGGLSADKSAFNDPNVTLTRVYCAFSTYGLPGFSWLPLELYGFFKFVGIYGGPFSGALEAAGLADRVMRCATSSAMQQTRKVTEASRGDRRLAGLDLGPGAARLSCLR